MAMLFRGWAYGELHLVVMVNHFRLTAELNTHSLDVRLLSPISVINGTPDLGTGTPH